MSNRVALAPLPSRDVPQSPSGLSPPAPSRAFVVVHTDKAGQAPGSEGASSSLPPPLQPGVPERGAERRESASTSESDSLRRRKKHRSRTRRYAPSSDDVASGGGSWFAFAKKNTPALISVFAVVLNVIVLSVLIPSMRSDIVFMQGQSSVFQAQMLNMQTSMLGITEKVVGAGTAIEGFYSDLDSITRTFNQTKMDIISFRADTQEDLRNMQASATQTLSEFTQASSVVSVQLSAFQLQLNASIASAQVQSAAIELQLAAAQVTVQSSMRDLLSNSSAARAAISDTAALYSSAAQASLQALLSTNASAVLRLESTRDEFVQRTVPAIRASLQSLNQSAAIAQLSAGVSVTNRNLSALTSAYFTPPTFHFVADPITGLGSTFVTMRALDGTDYSPALRHPRFWKDVNNVVHLEGWLGDTGACTAFPCTALRLPPLSGWMPLTDKFCVVPTSNDLTAGIIIKPVTGEVTIQWAGNHQWVVLDGISFSVN